MDNIRNDVEYYLSIGRVLSARVGSLIKIVVLMDDNTIMIQTIDTSQKTVTDRSFSSEHIGPVMTEMDNFAPLALWLQV